MRGVNLLPPEYRAAGRRRLALAGMVVGMALLLGVGAAVPIAVARWNQALQDRMAALAGRTDAAELERVAGMLRRLRQLEEGIRAAEAAAVPQGIRTVAGALAAVERAAGPVTVDRLALDAQGGVVVEGRAASVRDVVALVRGMAAGGLSEVDVVFPQPFRDGVAFKVTARAGKAGR